MIAGVVILGMIMSILDTTIVNVALHTLSHDLHSTISQVQWVITGYLLSLAAVIPVTGWAARRFGAKRVYLISLVLFTAGSALCGLAGLAHDAGDLPRAPGSRRRDDHAGRPDDHGPGRGPQADGQGDGRRRDARDARADPRPGGRGVILQNLHWSWIFFVNVPIGVIAFVLGWRMLPHTDSGEAGPLDVLGLALLPTGAAAIVYGLCELGTGASLTARERHLRRSSPGCALTLAFCWHALRVERPLLDVRLYANRVFAGASLTTFGLGASLFGAMILVPLYYQEVRGESVINTGLLNGPQGIGCARGDAARRAPDRALRRRADGDRRSLDPVPEHDPVHVRRGEHLDPRDLARAGRARSEHRAVASCRR